MASQGSATQETVMADLEGRAADLLDRLTDCGWVST